MQSILLLSLLPVIAPPIANCRFLRVIRHIFWGHHELSSFHPLTSMASYSPPPYHHKCYQDCFTGTIVSQGPFSRLNSHKIHLSALLFWFSHLSARMHHSTHPFLWNHTTLSFEMISFPNVHWGPRLQPGMTGYNPNEKSKGHLKNLVTTQTNFTI